MAQIPSQPSDTSIEIIRITSDDPDLDITGAKDLAKETALERTPMPMLLSWNNRKAGTFYPAFECGKSDKPAWIVFAESRGANLTVDINDGEFTFMFLKL